MKAFTDIEQSKKLAEILPLESADMWFHPYPNDEDWYDIPNIGNADLKFNQLPCWSLAALLSLIKDKCGYFELVYLKQTSDSKANPLENVYRLSTDVYDVYDKEAIDACYKMILKLHE